jgi:hypothetical protein
VKKSEQPELAEQKESAPTAAAEKLAAAEQAKAAAKKPGRQKAAAAAAAHAVTSAAPTQQVGYQDKVLLTPVGLMKLQHLHSNTIVAAHWLASPGAHTMTEEQTC